jgi:hypothetical protein
LFDQDESDEAIFAAVDILGRRGIQKYGDMLYRIASERAEVRVGWATRTGTRRVSMGYRTAAQRRSRLESIEVTTLSRSEEGRLDEAGIRRGYFEFITEEKAVLSGRVNPVLVQDLEKYFNKACRALFTVTIVTDRVSGKSSQSFRLDALVNPGEAFFSDPAEVM